MRSKIIKSLFTLAMLGVGGCVAFVFVGCQTRATWEKYPETALPIQEVRQVNGVDQVITVGYQMVGGGFCVTARSPLFAKEQLSGFKADTYTNGMFSVSVGAYERDLSTNAVVMTKTIFDGSANLALAVAKAYATISTGGATDATSALVSKVVSYFKSKGGDASKSTVTADPASGKITVTDGSTCISCDADGNCSDCSYSP
ncbi:MAG: hypothetical protein J6V72_09170 [Kiritimatiellae bacterium]|nr:hypothetical protein [Kiritimatiellia bacterium]